MTVDTWAGLFLAAWLAGAAVTAAGYIYGLRLLARQHADELQVMISQLDRLTLIFEAQTRTAAEERAALVADANSRIAAVRADRDALVGQLRADAAAAVAAATAAQQRWEHLTLEAFGVMSATSHATLQVAAVVDKQAAITQAVVSQSSTVPPEGTSP